MKKIKHFIKRKKDVSKKILKVASSKHDKPIKDVNKKQQSITVTLTIILGIIIITLGIIFIPKYLFAKNLQASNEYHGFNFVKKNGLWHFDVQQKGSNNVFTIPLHYHPSELENITVVGDPTAMMRLIEKSGVRGIFITFNPVDPNLTSVALATSELSINLKQALNIQPIPSCYFNTTKACEKIPIVQCEMGDRFVIYPKTNLNNETKISESMKTCIVLEGDAQGLVKAAEKLLYIWYGVLY